jgi:hypothetical protein
MKYPGCLVVVGSFFSAFSVFFVLFFFPIRYHFRFEFFCKKSKFQLATGARAQPGWGRTARVGLAVGPARAPAQAN